MRKKGQGRPKGTGKGLTVVKFVRFHPALYERFRKISDDKNISKAIRAACEMYTEVKETIRRREALNNA